MSKLSFRARPLEVSKPMPIFMSEELPDLPEYSAINRAVPQMPSGMKKEEECEHHLQRAMVTGLIIPTPEVNDVGDISVYDLLYPPNYKVSRQLIHMQPFTMEQDIPEYDMDSEDERWLAVHSKNLDIDELKFEEMMDRLEKNSGHSVVTQAEAKILLKEDDDLILAVYDYWLNKRLRLQQALIPCVKTESHRGGNNNNNPYLAFRRRTEKMQTRKNRKNDESTYEKMVKLKRDLRRAATCLDLVKKRECTKKEYLSLTMEIFEKRYQAQDYSGSMLAEVAAMKTSRPAFAPIFPNQYNHGTTWPKPAKDEYIPRKEKRQYKKRKHKSTPIMNDLASVVSSGDDDGHNLSPTSPTNDEAQFVFRRRRQCIYQAPLSTGLGNWPWCSVEEGGMADQRFRFSLTSIATPNPRCVGFARRRVGRGGRVILDRAGPSMDDFWASWDFTIHDNTKEKSIDTTHDNATEKSNDTIPDYSKEKLIDSETKLPITEQAVETSSDESKPLVPDTFQDWLHFRPKTPIKSETEEEEVYNVLNSSSMSLMIEDVAESADELIPVQLNLNELFPGLVFDSPDHDLNKQESLEAILPPSECEMEFQAVEVLRSVDPITSEVLLTNIAPKSVESDLEETRNIKRVCFDKKEYQNQSGSLLDRWARCESLPPEQPLKIKKVVTSEPFFCDDISGSSAFRTCNLWTEPKIQQTTVESSSISPTLLEEQIETSSVVQEAPAPPATPPKQIKTPPAMTPKHRANNTSQLLSNGPVKFDLSNNRLLSKQLGSNSSYRKKNNHIHNHGRNNKVIMRLPKNTGDLIETSVISSQVITDKNPNEALMRKSTQVPMEVT